jgi:hypothetical protein
MAKQKGYYQRKLKMPHPGVYGMHVHEGDQVEVVR